MEFYLDSANIQEIEEAMGLGFIHGLTTTPTFMHRDGITDIDGTIVKLAGMVPMLQIEALGEKRGEIVDEAHRLLDLGIESEKTVFKIPISMEGARACNQLRSEGHMVNLHLVYSLQQAYMAFSAGATYVCPLVGRLQDQGYDALGLVQQCIDTVDRYGYDSKIMFSSVRHPEHVRNALNIGVHTCTIPWKVIKTLFQNHFTDIGTQQFFEHTRLTTITVMEGMRKEDAAISEQMTIADALVSMSNSRLGAVAVVDHDGYLKGVFTDGDVRRMRTNGNIDAHAKLSTLTFADAKTIESDALLAEASKLFKEHRVDTLAVIEQGKPIGMLDIHDLLSSRLP